MDGTTDVVVVGAGPTGLLVAAELAMAGVDVQVIERRSEPDPTVKAGSINVATAEILDRRGLLPAAQRAHRAMVAEVGRFAEARADGGPRARSWDRQLSGHADRSFPAASGFPVAGHFAGMLFRPDLVNQCDPVLRAHSAVAGATLVPQRDVEAILADHAAALGVVVRRGVEVTGLDQDDDTVTLTTSAGPLTARWVVGADGGRSAVRKLSGIGFPGTDQEIVGHQAIVDLDGAEALQAGWTWTPKGVYSHGPIPGRILTVQFGAPPVDRSAPVTPDEVQASLRLVSGADVTVTKLHGTATRWTDNARQAESYRRGRVLLAGDAAHVHSPFSGQGLNLGVGDAVNLGWKLGATIAGWAPPGLLDTYTAERHPIGAWVLDWTRAQVALMRGDPQTARLREVVERQLLGTTEGMTRLVKLASGIGQHYTVDGADGTAGVDANGDGMGVGRLVGDVALADGTRLADQAHGGRFVLLDRTPDGALGRATGPWQERVVAVSDPADAATSLLVRPDGVVIWAAEGGAAAGKDRALPDALHHALLCWAGAPALLEAA